jgi:uncharacterized protein (TIGR03086 family)
MTNTTNTQPLIPAEAPVAATDPRAVFGRAVVVGSAVIAGVRPDQLDRPTPCDDLTVRDLLGHVVDVMNRVTLIGRGADPMSGPRTDCTTVADDDWPDRFRAAAEAGRAAWAHDGALAVTVALPWATMSGPEALDHYTSELTVHTWDLAVATGQQPQWDEQVLDVALAASRRNLPADDRPARFEALIAKMPAHVRPKVPPFADAVEVAPGAPTIDQLVAWTGRRP